MYLFIIFLLSVLIIIILINNNEKKSKIISNNDIINETNISQYRLKLNKINNTDKFNIKEYDSINENIIVHNKFKNELLDYYKKKHDENKYIDELNKKYYQDKCNKIIKNVDILKDNELYEKIILINNEIKSIKLLFKNDLNNLLNDIKINNLSSNTKNELKIKLNNEIVTINKELNKYQNNNDLNHIKYIKLLKIKLNLLNKKLTIYNKILT